MNDCDFTYDANCGVCSRCGFRLCNARPPIRRRCEVQLKPGLGDMVASGLSAIGVTKARVSKLAGGDCGCSKRQEALNALGRKIGIS